MSVGAGFLEGGSGADEASVSSAGPLQRELGKALQPSGTLFASRLAGRLCSKQGWMGQGGEWEGTNRGGGYGGQVLGSTAQARGPEHPTPQTLGH